MRLLSVSLLLFALTGCDGGADREAIEGSWTLARVEDARGAALGFRESSIRFGPGDAYASASCNRCQGAYALDDDAVTVAASCTEIGCIAPPGADAGYVADLGLLGEHAVAFRSDSLALRPAEASDGRTFVFVRAR